MIGMDAPKKRLQRGGVYREKLSVYRIFQDSSKGRLGFRIAFLSFAPIYSRA